MKLKEMRIREFPGVRNVRYSFESNGFAPMEEANPAPGGDCGSQCRESLLRDALAWVLFGTSSPEGNGGENSESRHVELDFDNYSIHRRKLADPPGTALRLFEYSTYTFCCARTVKELSAANAADTQKLLETRIEACDQAFLATVFGGSRINRR